MMLEKSRSGIIRMTSTAFNDILVDHPLWEKLIKMWKCAAVIKVHIDVPFITNSTGWILLVDINGRSSQTFFTL